ncbi:MAG TPA: cyclodeaminase/cyclohydrolase family protein [Trebonia sp.]
MSGTAGTPVPKAVRDLNIATFLSQLSARTTAPGEGAAADGLMDEALGLAEDLLSAANRNVISDLAAAAAAISAAAVTARVNIEANLAGIKDDTLHAELADVAGLADGVTDRADRLIAAVREEMGQ